MTPADADDLVQFEDVDVIKSTGPALLCQIGRRRVWLPRSQVTGKLWCAGDRGKLFIRRSFAREQDLIPAHAPAPPPLRLVIPPAGLPR